MSSIPVTPAIRSTAKTSRGELGQLRKVVSLIVVMASRVKKAWWPVTMTFGKARRRCSTSSVMMVLDRSRKN